jgi:hypothetical protein
MNRIRLLLTSTVLIVTSGLVSCGGGGDSSSPPPLAPAPSPVLQEPQDQTVSVGSSATFSVTFAGSIPAYVQWLKGSTPIPGATSTTYTTPPTRSADDGLMYSVQYSPPYSYLGAPSYTSMARLAVIPPVPVAAAGAFLAAGSMVLNRQSHIAVALLSGKVLIAGGSPTDSTSFPERWASAELYDPISNTFAATGSMSTSRGLGHAAVRLPNGTVLVCGGEDYERTTLKSAEIYDPATGRFSPTGAMQFARTRHSAVLLANGKVLVVGGVSDLQGRTSAELYDPSTGVFTPSSQMTQERLAQALQTPDGALVLGGTTADLYSAAAASFTPLATPVVGAWGAMASTRLQTGKIAVMGGSLNASGFQSMAYLFDPTTSAFLAIGELIWPRAGATATELKDGRILLFGGAADGRYPDRAELLNLTTGNVSALASSGAGRIFHTATLLTDGRVLIAGGLGYSTSGSAEARPLLFVP